MLSFVIGISAFTFIAYATGHPDWTAWTNTVPVATPTATAFILIVIAIILRK